jgi:PEP-CTERM motif
MSMTRNSLFSLALLGLFLLPSIALADNLQVQVGYADNLRGSPFFPSPWCGDPGTTFDGSSANDGCGMSFDSGAIRIINNGAATVSVSAVSVNVGGVVTAIWNNGGAFTIAPGESAILAQTSNSQNFDSSDQPNGPFSCCVNDGVIPVVTITADSVTKMFSDTGQVLNTSGVDFACETLDCSTNESFGWRDIGTFGGQPGTPEPSTLLLLGTGLLGLVGITWRKLLD